ncbi:MAG: DUF484 family protein [Pseudomonadota bacterium]
MSDGLYGPPSRDALREWVMGAPEVILEDPEIMRALLSREATEARRVVDLRGALIARLEQRLSALQEAHHDVVEAAYDSLSDMAQTHGAVLTLLECSGVGRLAERIRDKLPEVLRVDAARLCLSSGRRGGAARVVPAELLERCAPARSPRPIKSAKGPDRPGPSGAGDPAVAAMAMSLRPMTAEDSRAFGPAAKGLGGVAVITLDLGADRGPAALMFAVAEPDQLHVGGLPEVLSFVGAVVERLIRAQDSALRRGRAAAQERLRR